MTQETLIIADSWAHLKLVQSDNLEVAPEIYVLNEYARMLDDS